MTNTHQQTRSKAKKRKLPILARHAVSLTLAFVVALLASYFVGQRVYRNIQLGKLTSDIDATDFQQGLAYVYNHASQSPAVTERAIQIAETIYAERAGEILVAIAYTHINNGLAPPVELLDATGQTFARMTPRQSLGLYDALFQMPGIDADLLGKHLLETIEIPSDPSAIPIVDLLEQRLLWSEPQVPADKWLNWLAVLAQNSDAELTQHKAASLLGELPEQADHPQVTQSLKHLANSEHDTVRAKALTAIAGYAGVANDPADYEQMLFTLGQDENKTIARRAWLAVGHLNPLSGFAVNWKDADPFVAEAMLWASVKTNPENTKAVYDAYDAADTHKLSLQALVLLNDDDSTRRFKAVIKPTPLEQINIDPQRLINAISTGNDIPDYTINIASISLAQHTERAEQACAQLIRTHQSPGRIIGTFASVIAEIRPTLVSGITAQTLLDYPDLDTAELIRMSDDELAEYGLKRVDALPALLEVAEAAPASVGRQAEVKLLQLALWMRGDLGDDFTPVAEAMLFDETLPTSTVLMCLLHQQRPIAFEYLFGDLVQPRPNLHELFIQQRYWHVFRRFVDTSDLTLWLWGDPQAQAFQLEAMRQWYAVNRWKIEAGWWPVVDR